MLAGICLAIGIFCLLYYIFLVIVAGFSLSFSGIWILLGLAGFLAAGFMKNHRHKILAAGIPKWICLVAGLVFLAGLLLFVAAQGCIISGMTARQKEPVDGVVVLGAKVYGTRVSRALGHRLRKAVEILEENPESYVIVSGGQGAGEDISEAEAMKRYLIDRGIDLNRIIMEDQSVNTEQNLRFSFALAKVPEDRLGVISNGFHVFRAVHIAKAQGRVVQGIPAGTDWWMLPHYMMREAFALVKDFLVGNAVF